MDCEKYENQINDYLEDSLDETNKIQFESFLNTNQDFITANLNLSKSQKHVFNKILPYVDSKQYRGFLIHGVPGSGKTEVYIKLAQKCIQFRSRGAKINSKYEGKTL